MTQRISIPCLLVSLLASATALAEEGAVALDSSDLAAEPPSDSDFLYERGGLAGTGLTPGVKVGGSFSGAFTELGTAPAYELELGYILPFLNRSFEVFVAGQYTNPKTDGKNVVDADGPDGASRLPGPMSYKLTQEQMIVTLGPLYRLPLSIPMFRPYVALGGRMYMMRTTVKGSAGGQPFGTNEETANAFGFYGALGGELHVGPGAILLEAQLGYSKIDGFIMRDTNTGTINAALGYRFFL